MVQATIEPFVKEAVTASRIRRGVELRFHRRFVAGGRSPSISDTLELENVRRNWSNAIENLRRAN